MTRARGQHVRATCVCCCGLVRLRVIGPTVWKAEVLCHRCNVKECGAAETFHGCGLGIDACLRAHGCKSRLVEVDGAAVRQPILRYQGVA